MVYSIHGHCEYHCDWAAVLAGSMTVDDSLPNHKLDITWAHKDSVARLQADMVNKEWDITFKCPKTGSMVAVDFEHLGDTPDCAVACDFA